MAHTHTTTMTTTPAFQCFCRHTCLRNQFSQPTVETLTLQIAITCELLALSNERHTCTVIAAALAVAVFALARALVTYNGPEWLVHCALFRYAATPPHTVIIIFAIIIVTATIM